MTNSEVNSVTNTVPTIPPKDESEINNQTDL
jgi:hypothetical protein